LLHILPRKENGRLRIPIGACNQHIRVPGKGAERRPIAIRIPVEFIAIEGSPVFPHMVVGAGQLHVHRLLELLCEEGLRADLSDVCAVKGFHGSATHPAASRQNDFDRRESYLPQLALQIIHVKTLVGTPQRKKVESPPERLQGVVGTYDTRIAPKSHEAVSMAILEHFMVDERNVLAQYLPKQVSVVWLFLQRM